MGSQIPAFSKQHLHLLQTFPLFPTFQTFPIFHSHPISLEANLHLLQVLCHQLFPFPPLLLPRKNSAHFHASLAGAALGSQDFWAAGSRKERGSKKPRGLHWNGTKNPNKPSKGRVQPPLGGLAVKRVRQHLYSYISLFNLFIPDIFITWYIY